MARCVAAGSRNCGKERGHTSEWDSERANRWWCQRKSIRNREGVWGLNLNWRTNWMTVAAMLISINLIFIFSHFVSSSLRKMEIKMYLLLVLINACCCAH